MNKTEKLQEIYKKVDKWLEDQGVNISIQSLSDKELYFYSLLSEMPGLSWETAETFYDRAVLIAG